MVVPAKSGVDLPGHESSFGNLKMSMIASQWLTEVVIVIAMVRKNLHHPEHMKCHKFKSGALYSTDMAGEQDS